MVPIKVTADGAWQLRNCPQAQARAQKAHVRKCTLSLSSRLSVASERLSLRWMYRFLYLEDRLITCTRGVGKEGKGLRFELTVFVCRREVDDLGSEAVNAWVYFSYIACAREGGGGSNGNRSKHRVGGGGRWYNICFPPRPSRPFLSLPAADRRSSASGIFTTTSGKVFGIHTYPVTTFRQPSTY